MERLPTIWAASFIRLKDKATVWTGAWLSAAERRPACNAARLSDRVGDSAVFADYSSQALRELMTGSRGARCPIYLIPHQFGKLQVLHVLRDIVQPREQIPGVHERRERGSSQGGRGAEPFLLAQPYHDPVRRLLECDGERRLPARLDARARRYLHCHSFTLVQHLCTQVASVELGHEALCQHLGFYVTVQKSLLHLFDYNREAISLLVSSTICEDSGFI